MEDMTRKEGRFPLAKSELYYPKDSLSNGYYVDLPACVRDYYGVCFYKPLHESFIIKKNKLIHTHAVYPKYRLVYKLMEKY